MSDKKFIKVACPKCGRNNVRHRSSAKFAAAPFHCQLCGHNWKEKETGAKDIPVERVAARVVFAEQDASED